MLDPAQLRCLRAVAGGQIEDFVAGLRFAGARDERMVLRLVRTNWIRTRAWTARAVLVTQLVLERIG